MKAMILAAGYGTRLRPHTETTPKPLLNVAGIPILERHIKRLVSLGIKDLVINTSWLADQIEEYFADGAKFGVHISWSREQQPLETGGGIARALPLLGEQPFLLINGDIWTDFALSSIAELGSKQRAWLLLVNNPDHNASGDFGIKDGLVTFDTNATFTFSGVSVMHPKLFADYILRHPQQQAFPLRDVLRPAIKVGEVTATVYDGFWCDMGTVERYQQLNDYFNQQHRSE